MFQYTTLTAHTGMTSISDINNVMLIRKDIHDSLDRREFVFVPKQGDCEGDIDVQIVVHKIEGSDEHTQLYHNTKLQPGPPIPAPFLLVRLAWALFPMLEGFLLAGMARKLVIHTEEKEYSARECEGFARQNLGKDSNSNNSNKRARKDDTQGNGIQGNEAQVDEALQSECQDPQYRNTKRRRVSSKAFHQDTQHDASTAPCAAHSPSFSPPTTPVEHEHNDDVLQLTISSNNTSSKSRLLSQRRHNPTESLTQSPPSSPTIALPKPLYILPEGHSLQFQALKERFIENERNRSDKAGLWQKELEWAHRAACAGDMSPEEIQRYYEIMRGDEDRDEEGVDVDNV